MVKIIACLVSVAVAALAGVAHAGAGDIEMKDAQGRVTSRTTNRAGGSSHRTALSYGSGSDQPRLVVDEDLDALGRPTKRVEQLLGRQGQTLERLEVSISAAGRNSGARTRYRYDRSGGRSEEVTPIDCRRCEPHLGGAKRDPER